MNKKQALKDFIDMVKRDKQRAQYFDFYRTDKGENDIVFDIENGVVNFRFMPFNVITEKRLSNGGTLYCEDIPLLHEKDGSLIAKQMPFGYITPSNISVTDTGEYWINHKYVGENYKELLNKRNPNNIEKAMIKEIKDTENLAKKEVEKMCDAFNYYNENYTYWKHPTLKAHPTRAPQKKQGIRRLENSVRRMF